MDSAAEQNIETQTTQTCITYQLDVVIEYETYGGDLQQATEQQINESGNMADTEEQFDGGAR